MADPIRILTPDAQYKDENETERKDAPAAYDFETYRLSDPEAIPDESWRAADVLLCWHECPISAETIAKLDNCKLIVRCGFSTDHIDLAAAAAKGIPVCNIPDFAINEIADHTMALILAMRRKVQLYHSTLRANPESGYFHAAATVRRMTGNRIGVVGLGRTGLAVALRAKAFGLVVHAYDVNLTPGIEQSLGIERADRLEDLLGVVDIVTLHCPLTDETENMINRETLAYMRQNAILVNVSHGKLVDLDALYDALADYQISGACLDVLPEEPPSTETSKLIRDFQLQPEWLSGRLILTPHAGWYSYESQEDARSKSIELVTDHLEAGRLRNCINLDDLVLK
ncbi:MAG: C-terminal binding protein [Alphaproteobacteria bacterium]|nr:C-terminal binding protein [Alphaproteobacteria bacterium]